MTYDSRQQQREFKFYRAAEKGLFSISVYLYKSEIRSLLKAGFSIEVSKDSKNAVPCEISWKEAFNTGIPTAVQAYINKEIKTFPSRVIANLPQELYIISFMAV